MTNADRAERAERAITAYMGDDGEFYLHDLICDLGHWLDRVPFADAGENATLREACAQGINAHEDERDDEPHYWRSDPAEYAHLAAWFDRGEGQD